ncbi:MAG: DUF983 domain-containing protein [Chitinophagaceae bacterium]|nr:DUF983 domain-containing protein [Chitinophagaceae bacterium]
MSKESRPNMMWSVLTMRCPRCRHGKMFTHGNPWNLGKVLEMPKRCAECNQPFELEVGFWWGTGYVSYGLSVALSLVSFAIWYILIGTSTKDNRFFWWLGINVFLLLAFQPWLMRISRVIYLYFFVSYNPNYKVEGVTQFDYQSDEYMDEKNQ